MTSSERPAVQAIERDVAAERERVDNTLRELQDRLTPGQLVDEVLRHGRGAGSDFVANLGRTLSSNPVPTALVGVGLLWLLLVQKPASTNHSTASDADTSAAPPDTSERG